MAFPTSPNDQFYQIPTGSAYLTLSSGNLAGQRLNLGNVVGWTVTANVQTKEHKKNYGGRRTVDKTRVTEIGATGKGTLDEITPLSVALFALGDVEDNSDGTYIIRGLTKTSFEGFLEIIGDNDEGPQLDWKGDVQFVPSGDFSLIKDDDEYNKISVSCTVLEGSGGEFGEWTWRAQAA